MTFATLVTTSIVTGIMVALIVALIKEMKNYEEKIK
jgi:ABC-type arginine/histidine transport system permease subunit